MSEKTIYKIKIEDQVYTVIVEEGVEKYDVLTGFVRVISEDSCIGVRTDGESLFLEIPFNLIKNQQEENSSGR